MILHTVKKWGTLKDFKAVSNETLSPVEIVILLKSL